MRILGISCHYHDAAATLVLDGRVAAAAEEERFTRRKHDASFPRHAARWCLEEAGLVAKDLDHVVFYEKPLLKFERIISGYAAVFPGSAPVFVRAMRAWLREKLWIESEMRRELAFRGPLLFGEHHLSHAASAFYPSPFQQAAVVTADGVGEWATTTIGVGDGLDLGLIREIRYPHSLGLLYSAFTAYLGFEVNEGEYKVMGMAAYGQPRYIDRVQRVVRLLEDGSYRLDMRYFAYQRSMRAYGQAFLELFGPPRQPGDEIDQHAADIAASVQLVLEHAMLALARTARALTGLDNLCLAGGVALNVLANARIAREAGFKRVWIQPAAGDSGGSMGAALHVAHAIGRDPRVKMVSAKLGPDCSDQEVFALLERERIAHRVVTPEELIAETAARLAAGQVVGWCRGRMEFGPRALGSRSILADPTDERMKDIVNLKIKHREPFRPFAPSVTAEAASTYFQLTSDSPFMLLAVPVRPEWRERLPAITHADGTARVHTVDSGIDPTYHALLREFSRRRGVPVLMNTSFNLRGEPIVRTAAEAFNTFSHTELDFLVLGPTIIEASAKRALAPYPGGKAISPEVVI